MYSTQESRIELVLKLMGNGDLYSSASPNNFRAEGEGWVASGTGHPFAVLNDIFLYGDKPEAVNESITFLNSKGVPGIVKVMGSAQHLIPLLLEKGYRFSYSSPVMIWEDDGSLGDFELINGLSIRQLDPSEKATVWQVYKDVYSMPDTLREAFSSLFLETEHDFTYGLYKDGVLLSLVTAMVDGDLVGIWGMGTPTEHQKNGYGAQLLRKVMKIHVERGGALFILGSSTVGKSLYDKLGWKTIEYIPHYALADEKKD